MNSSRCSAVYEGHSCGFLSFIHALQAQSGGPRSCCRTFLMFGCDERTQRQSCATCRILGANRANVPLDNFCRQCSRLSRLEIVKQPKHGPHTPPHASVHTCTDISRLISCESCSLETLNHSFSILSRAASLAVLTRGSTLFAQHCRRLRQRWWARGIFSRWSSDGLQGEASDLDREGWRGDVRS